MAAKWYPVAGEQMDDPSPSVVSLDPSADSRALPRVLGIWDAIALVVGGVIGSGIFVKEASLAQNVGSFGPIIAVWIVMGIVTCCGALALAELAALLPEAGGPYVYLREAYGRLPAFLWGWTEFWIIRTSSLASLACATAIYLGVLVPVSIGQQTAIAAAVMVTLAWVNACGIRWGSRVQKVTTCIKVGFLLAIITLPWLLGKADVSRLQPWSPAEYNIDFVKIIGLAMISVLWPYDGWTNIGSVAEEIREPQRNVPIALGLGMLAVTTIYVLATFSYHLVLPFDEIAKSQRVAADTCQALLGPVGAKIAAVGVMCSTLGACNSNLIAGPRIYFAVARDGMLPEFVSRIRPGAGTPANAIWLQTIWALVLLTGVYLWVTQPVIDPNPGAAISRLGEAPPPAHQGNLRDVFDELTDFVIFGGQLFYALAVGAVFVLRRKYPNRPRPYRTWGYPITPLIYLAAFAAAIVSLLLGKPVQTLAGSVLILAGVVYYRIRNSRRASIR
jgi:APA family basic amino acid/polyamine antiporter